MVRQLAPDNSFQTLLATHRNQILYQQFSFCLMTSFDCPKHKLALAFPRPELKVRAHRTSPLNEDFKNS